MSKTNDLKTVEAIKSWRQTFELFNTVIPAYVSFLADCYKGLLREGIPSNEAASMAAQTFQIHLNHWCGAQNRSNQEAQKSHDPLSAILASVSGKGN